MPDSVTTSVHIIVAIIAETGSANTNPNGGIRSDGIAHYGKEKKLSDLINRQNAIMHFVKASENYECGIFSLAEVTHELWEIPSAEHHKLNIAEYIHDFYPDVWKHAEKELEVPSAQRKGKWAKRTTVTSNGNIYYSYECSECGDHHGTLWNYCPHCGARMVSEDDK